MSSVSSPSPSLSLGGVVYEGCYSEYAGYETGADDFYASLGVSSPPPPPPRPPPLIDQDDWEQGAQALKKARSRGGAVSTHGRRLLGSGSDADVASDPGPGFTVALTHTQCASHSRGLRALSSMGPVACDSGENGVEYLASWELARCGGDGGKTSKIAYGCVKPDWPATAIMSPPECATFETGASDLKNAPGKAVQVDVSLTLS